MKDAPSIQPVAQPVTGDGAQVWSALAELGRQLQNLARAQSGQADFSAHASRPPGSSPDGHTVGELTREFLLAKARAGKSDRYLRALKNSIGKFSHGRNAVALSQLTVHDFEKWLDGTGWSARTQKGYLGDVRTLLNFAVRRGYLEKNPAAGVELPDCDAAPQSLHTPDEVKKVLEFARRYDLNVCRALAVRYFAGLRSAEADKLEEKFIGAKYIEVTAANSKTRRRRLVTITDNLRAWLALGGALPVFGCKNNLWRLFNAALLKQTGVAWQFNVTRHSFCSYHLAKFENASKTAMQAGHTEQMLFSHYREICTPEAAEAYFSIVPTL